MLGSCSAQGIIEIYGLQTIASIDHSIFERDVQILKGMMDAKDYRWRLFKQYLKYLKNIYLFFYILICLYCLYTLYVYMYIISIILYIIIK